MRLFKRIRIFQSRSLVCVINQNFCSGDKWYTGYVEIPKGSKLLKSDRDFSFSNHGTNGITFIGQLKGNDKRIKDKFFLGFDFNHPWDKTGGSVREAELMCYKLAQKLRDGEVTASIKDGD